MSLSQFWPRAVCIVTKVLNVSSESLSPSESSYEGATEAAERDRVRHGLTWTWTLVSLGLLCILSWLVQNALKILSGRKWTIKGYENFRATGVRDLYG